VRSLRFDGENDEAFRQRAERVAIYAKLLVKAALANKHIQELIADPKLPHNEESERHNPTVRVEYEEAIAIGGIGESLAATKSKHWGKGPNILPLKPDDLVNPMFVHYLFRENSLHNRRYEQRQRLKQLLGREFRLLVRTAKYHTKTAFIQDLTDRQSWAIRRVLGCDPSEFWRACKGKTFLVLPQRDEEVYFDFMCDD